MQTLAERGERRFDLSKTRVVPEREQAFDVRLGYSNSAGELRFRQTSSQKRRVEVNFGNLQGRQRYRAEFGPAAACRRRQLSVSFRQACVEGRADLFLREIGRQDATHRGAPDLEPASDLGFADAGAM